MALMKAWGWFVQLQLYNKRKQWKKVSKNTTVMAKPKNYEKFGLKSLADTPAEQRLPTPMRLPRNNSRAGTYRQIAIALNMAGKAKRFVTTPNTIGDVWITDESIEPIVKNGKSGREQFAHYILPTLENPLEVWVIENENKFYFIARFEEDIGEARFGFAVVKKNLAGLLLLTMFYTIKKYTEIDKQRVGYPIYIRQK